MNPIENRMLKLTLAEQEIFRVMFMNGDSRSTIKARLHIGASAIARYAKNMGLPVRPNKRPYIISKEVGDMILRQFNTLKWSVSAIAEELELSPATVKFFLKRAGVSMRPVSDHFPACSCVVCHKKIPGSRKYCDLHSRLVVAECNRDIQRIRQNVKNPRLTWSVWDDVAYADGYRGPTEGEWKHRQSGYGGPVVLQLETGDKRK